MNVKIKAINASLNLSIKYCCPDDCCLKMLAPTLETAPLLQALNWVRPQTESLSHQEVQTTKDSSAARYSTLAHTISAPSPTPSIACGVLFGR